jgi:molybdenum transport protein
MIYYPDDLIDSWIMDDISQGDLTTRALGIGGVPGTIRFSLKNGGRVSGVCAAERVLRKLGLEVTAKAEDGTDIAAGGTLLAAKGRAERLHGAWKVTQNILEWACGVAEYTASMVRRVKEVSPRTEVAATRKNIPGTKLLALSAVLDGGGIIHRGSAAETILLFANHRRFLGFSGGADDWKRVVGALRGKAPEKKIVVEADTVEEARFACDVGPDIVQLDKFPLPDFRAVVDYARRRETPCMISAAGGVNRDNAADYAAAGAGLIVTSAPYYAKPADVKAVLQPEGNLSAEAGE